MRRGLSARTSGRHSLFLPMRGYEMFKKGVSGEQSWLFLPMRGYEFYDADGDRLTLTLFLPMRGYE